MKKFAVVILSVLTIPAYAQSILGSLQTYQKEIQPKSTSANPSVGPDAAVKVDPVVKTKSSGQCTEPEQTSLPLAYITAMIMEKDGKLAIQHDPRSGKITVSSPEMISNCSSMIEWVPNTRLVDGRKVYSLEAKIKKGEECADDGCTYDVAKVEKGLFKSFEKIKVKPTMVGFEQCLEKSGVVKGGKVVEDAIYPNAIDERFEGYKESGDVLFVSHGPSSKLIKAKYDKFVEIDKCDHYEKITPEGVALVSQQDSDIKNFAEEEKKVRECGEYEKISDFMARYEEEYSQDLNDIRDKLILEAVKKATKAIAEGKYTEEDLKVLADFDKYIVQPKITEAAMSFNKANLLEGSEKAAMLEHMKAVLAEVNTYNSAPYLSAPVTTKLEADGRFNEAQLVNGMRVSIDIYRRLGAKQDNVVQTPPELQQKIDNINSTYAKDVEGKREVYEIRTGQLSGKSKEYSNLVTAMNRNIQARSHSYGSNINDAMMEMQPGGYCYASPFRNSQKCVQENMQYIQALQTKMQHDNKVDYDRAQEYFTKAAAYQKLEKEGATYVARQNGEAPPAAAPADTITAPTRDQFQTAQTGQNPYAQSPQMFGQGQVQMQGQMQGQNPYAQQQYGMQGQQNMFAQQQNPYGQQGQAQYGYNNQQPQYGYTGQFNIGFGSQYGQQQQGMYGAGQQQNWSPNTAYSNYSMYGGGGY